jgi:hypothetical protein
VWLSKEPQRGCPERLWKASIKLIREHWRALDAKAADVWRASIRLEAALGKPPKASRDDP